MLNKTVMADLKEMRIVLLGRTGDGKSSSGNTILGDSLKFEVKFSPSSVTRECETGHRAGTKTPIKIIDTPGFFDTRMSDMEVRHEIVKRMALTAPGPHAFIIVLRLGKFTKQEAAAVAQINSSFREGAFKYSAVLFTHGNNLDEDQTIEQFVEQSKELKELVEKCRGRCHVIDNKYWNKEHKYRSNRVQVEKLLNTIEEMVRQNGGGCYTTPLLQQLWLAIEAFLLWIKDRPEAISKLVKNVIEQNPDLELKTLKDAFFGDKDAESKVVPLIQAVSKQFS